MASAADMTLSSGTASALKSIYESGKYSDLTIKCRGQVFRVHRAIVCPRSPVFAQMLDGNFKEAVTGEIDLPNDEALIVKKMLDFIYTSEYSSELIDGQEYVSISTKESSSSSSVIDDPAESTYQPLVIHAKIYVIADIYDIQDLKDLATIKYQALVNKGWNTPAFIRSLEEIYENTQEEDRKIKDVAMAVVKNRVKLLLCKKEFVALLKQNAELSFDVLCHSLGHPHQTKDSEDTQVCDEQEDNVADHICDVCGLSRGTINWCGKC